MTIVPVASSQSVKDKEREFPRKEPIKIARTSSMSSQSLPVSHVRTNSQSQNPDSASSHMTTGSNITETSFFKSQARQRGGIGGSRLMQIELKTAGSGRMKGRTGKEDKRKVERGRVERNMIGGLVATAKVRWPGSE